MDQKAYSESFSESTRQWDGTVIGNKTYETGYYSYTGYSGRYDKNNNPIEGEYYSGSDGKIYRYWGGRFEVSDNSHKEDVGGYEPPLTPEEYQKRLDNEGKLNLIEKIVLGPLILASAGFVVGRYLHQARKEKKENLKREERTKLENDCIKNVKTELSPYNETYDNAKRLYNEGKYKKSFELYNQLIKEKYPPAFNDIGIFYSEGKYVRKDLFKAYSNFLYAAQLGQSMGFYNIASLYCFDGYPEMNYERAFAFADKAARSGVKGASNLCGILLEDGGYGLKANSRLAYEYYKAAAMNNDPNGLYNMFAHLFYIYTFSELCV